MRPFVVGIALIFLFGSRPVKAISIGSLESNVESNLGAVGSDLLNVLELRDNFKLTIAKVHFGGPKYVKTPGAIPIPGLRHLFKPRKPWGRGEWGVIVVGTLTAAAIEIANSQRPEPS